MWENFRSFLVTINIFEAVLKKGSLHALIIIQVDWNHKYFRVESINKSFIILPRFCLQYKNLYELINNTNIGNAAKMLCIKINEALAMITHFTI